MLSYKNMLSIVGGCTAASYIDIFWNVLGILSSGEISQEKCPVFPDCYRLALGRVSSCINLVKYVI